MKALTIFLACVIVSPPSLAQWVKDEWVVCNPQGCTLLDPYYSEGVTITWSGGCANQKANGYGKLIKYQEGEYESTYEGEYNNGIREGKGKFTHRDGSVKEGTFVNGQLTGIGVMSDTKNGGTYTGNFVNYRMHGYGALKHPNGETEEGFFVTDRLYTGKRTSYDGKVSYIQQYKPVVRIAEKTTNYKPAIGTQVTEFFDESWTRCERKDATYYRLVTYEALNRPLGLVRDYYITGELQSEFNAVYLDYMDDGKNFYEGEAKWYYQNGRPWQKLYYSNNKIHGNHIVYYDNGRIKEETNYGYGTLHGESREWHKTGKIKSFSRYNCGALKDNKYVEYDESEVGTLIYNEDFIAEKETWEMKYEGIESKVTSDNSLHLIVQNNKLVRRFNDVDLDQDSDYSIESVIHKKAGKGEEGYGLLFGFQNRENYFDFIISESGYYLIQSKVEGISLPIKEWTKTSAINIGNKRNQLKVLKLRETFVFSINGQIVEKTEFKRLRGNSFGITASGNGTYVMENLIIKEFLSPESKSAHNPDAWKGNGSGFFIHENGYIVTNYHVVEEASSIQVEYHQKGIKYSHPAKVIVTDKLNDLAVIQIVDSKYKLVGKIPYVFSTTLKEVGTDVFTLGYPLLKVMGEEIKFTDGKISSKTGIKGDNSTYQISVPIQPGNSGSPVFDSSGNLVGVASSGLNKEHFNSENVNYAIKSVFLKNLIDTIPNKIQLPNDTEIHKKPLTEKIKLLSDYIPIIKVK